MRVLIDQQRLLPSDTDRKVVMAVVRNIVLRDKANSNPVDRVVDVFNDHCRAASPADRQQYHLGWLGTNTLAMLVPDPGPEAAIELGEQILEVTGLLRQSICLTFSDVKQAQATCQFQRGHIGEVRARPLPRWKRLTDIILASSLLLISASFLLLVSILIRITSKGPALYRQKRVGLGGRAFDMYKLRTMEAGADEGRQHLMEYNERDGGPFKMENDPRVTWIGRILRRTSMDELPQLFNVLRGDMSMVGPRPLPCEEWIPSKGWYSLRHDVTPGLTCYWQVDGRCRNVNFDEWMKMDLDYINRHTLRTDLKLILQTIHTVLWQTGGE
jgi:lipopolysaccharide/colanic/teichoic acid biosynthesis glycosyltransferase